MFYKLPHQEAALFEILTTGQSHLILTYTVVTWLPHNLGKIPIISMVIYLLKSPNGCRLKAVCQDPVMEFSNLSNTPNML